MTQKLLTAEAMSLWVGWFDKRLKQIENVLGIEDYQGFDEFINTTPEASLPLPQDIDPYYYEKQEAISDGREPEPNDEQVFDNMLLTLGHY